MKVYVLLDIGCLECGIPSHATVYKSKIDAKKECIRMQTEYDAPTIPDRIFEVVECEIIEGKETTNETITNQKNEKPNDLNEG
jgi:hypothetical protein